MLRNLALLGKSFWQWCWNGIQSTELETGLREVVRNQANCREREKERKMERDGVPDLADRYVGEVKRR